MISGIQFNLDQYIASNGIFCLLCQRWKEMNDWTNKWIEWEGRFDGTAISTLCFFMVQCIELFHLSTSANGKMSGTWKFRSFISHFYVRCFMVVFPKCLNRIAFCARILNFEQATYDEWRVETFHLMSSDDKTALWLLLIHFEQMNI